MPESQQAYRLAEDGSFHIADYDATPAFCSFLPGVAGPLGVPLWCMYVNRAQAVVSFGVNGKDNAIAEYLPATWAYQLVGTQGFRTFCKIDGAFYEPFRDGALTPSRPRRSMRIEMDRLELTERNETLGLEFTVAYFSPVNQPLGSLVRTLSVRNIGKAARQIELLDGLAQIMPAGLTDGGMKSLRHISEAYASVRLVGDRVPYYAAKVVAHDEAEVTRVVHGNFYAAWTCGGNGELAPVEPYVDPHIIFGGGNDLVTPRRFVEQESLDRTAQLWENRMPCALVPAAANLAPGATLDLVALVGFASHERLLPDFVAKFTAVTDFEAARTASREFVTSITEPARTHSALPLLDAYARQNYLDNILRGGVPTALPSKSGPTLLHLYSRRHGDLERDYNYFVLPPHPLSSGAGNYRDILQNRRNDIWVYPEVAASEIRMFVELLQADGYNPLGIEGYLWQLDSACDRQALCPPCDEDAQAEFAAIVERRFHPGELLHWARVNQVQSADELAWLNELLAQADRVLVAGGHEGGYWVDHWTYIVDLLEAFAAIYPERVAEVLTKSANVGWFDEGARVSPRREKYVRRSCGPLQLNAVQDGEPIGTPLPKTTVFGKLCALLAVKAVSFDYNGRGIEMEAGRPGWNDSMNGLPGLFGSSTCESAEVARLAAWLRTNLPNTPDTELPIEVAELINEIIADAEQGEYCWDRAATIRENYRTRIYAPTGQAGLVSADKLAKLLQIAERRGRTGLERSQIESSPLVHTYFMAEPILSDSNADRPLSESVERFEQQPLPLFLEGQVHWLRLQSEPDAARKIHNAVRSSPLFDQKLAMYKLNQCLDACPPEIGRARTFTRGWFENESIWLHMSYKYLLELLKCGLHAEFFADARTMLVPMMDPRVYGRSILENSSFLGSSANPDEKTHGRGFIARLSGSTAEFIHIWQLLTVGAAPFVFEDGQLRLNLQPTLPGDWFTQEPQSITHAGQSVELPAGTLGCSLLGSVLLVYHNDRRADTFGPHAAAVRRLALDGGSPIACADLAPADVLRIRERQIRRLHAWLE